MMFQTLHDSLFIVWWFVFAGHGMIVEESDMESHDHWGRRLMSSTADNVTEQKNCTEPGEMSISTHTSEQLTLCSVHLFQKHLIL